MMWDCDDFSAGTAVSDCAAGSHSLRAVLRFNGTASICTLGFLVGSVTIQITVPIDTSYEIDFFPYLSL